MHAKVENRNVFDDPAPVLVAAMGDSLLRKENGGRNEKQAKAGLRLQVTGPDRSRQKRGPEHPDFPE